MHGGAHIDPVGLRGKPVRHAAGTSPGRGRCAMVPEDNHCSDGNRHFTGLAFDHRLGGEHGRRAADAAAGADQPAGCVYRDQTLSGQEEAGDEKVLESVRTSIKIPPRRRRRQSGRTSGESRRGCPQAQQMLLGEGITPPSQGCQIFGQTVLPTTIPNRIARVRGAKARAGDGREANRPTGRRRSERRSAPGLGQMPQGTMFGG